MELAAVNIYGHLVLHTLAWLAAYTHIEIARLSISNYTVPFATENAQDEVLERALPE